MLPIETYITVIFLGLLSFVTTLIGVWLAFKVKENKKAVAVGIGFSSGIMISISIFELLPESLQTTSFTKTAISFLLGVLLIFLMHHIIPHTHLVEEKGKVDKIMKTGYLVAIGIVLHDFPEGIALANSYIFSPFLGLLVAISIALHNIPEEFAMSVPLVLANKKKFLAKLALFSALAEPLGAMIGLFAVSITPSLNPLFMSFAAGAMIFVSIHELLPLAKIYKRTDLFLLGSFLGFLVYLGLAFLIPE